MQRRRYEVVVVQHLARYLRIARLVRTNQPEAAKTVEEKQERERKYSGYLDDENAPSWVRSLLDGCRWYYQDCAQEAFGLHTGRVNRSL